MKKIIGLFLFLGVLSLAAGYARTAGPAPQSAGSIEPAGLLGSSGGREAASRVGGGGARSPWGLPAGSFFGGGGATS